MTKLTKTEICECGAVIRQW